MSAPAPALQRGTVKQILSGDTIVIRGIPRGGPPPERTFGLSNITAPKLARRPNPNVEGMQETKDEPYAWEAREFLRKRLVGKEVVFTVEYQIPGTGKEFGILHIGKDTSGENITESIVAEGLAETRRQSLKSPEEGQHKLINLEETAKAAGKGKWGSVEEVQTHIRNITWTLDNPRHFVDSCHGNSIEAVIEHVRDCCTVRAFLLPSFQYVTVMLAGIKGPMFRIEGGDPSKSVAEPFADEAKFYVESRLLQRDVHIVLEGEAGQSNLLGTVLHPNGNISELLLKEGFAHCADWSMGVVSQGPGKLREAEKIAREKKIKMWKDYSPASSTVDIKEKNFTAKVVEVVNGDCMIVKQGDGPFKKIFLASIRQPRPQQEPENKRDSKTRSRPLYDIPYMFEAREFLRKKLIGKKVNIQVDYVQPKTDDFPEKTCCTVSISSINVAEALVSKGLATVVMYRQGDAQRSAQYDDLLSAEQRAKKKLVGVHSKKGSPLIRVADVSGDVQKAKQFLPFLQRAGRTEGVVEFVASGSRLRLYIPRETCLVTFLLAGISCPRASRPTPGGAGTMMAAEPYGEEAQLFIKEMVLQREVEVEVESMDKGGNFVGWMFFEGVNVSLNLVEAGLSKMHFTAERSNHYSALSSAENNAKTKQIGVWKDYEEPKEVTPESEPQERKITYKTVIITEVTNELHFYAQNTENGPQLEKLMEQLRADMVANPPLPGSYSPKRGDTCAAKFVDGEWYRARVERVDSQSKVYLHYIDFGNKEITDSTQLATLLGTYQSLPAQAQQYILAGVMLPKDPEDVNAAVDTLYNETLNKQCLLNVEYKEGNIDCVSLLHNTDSKDDVGQYLLSEGYVLMENRREKRLQKLMSQYQKAQEKAKTARVNLWQYGDFTEDDAKEFGYQG